MASELPSHRAILTSSSTEKAKNYIQSREIPQLFEALMTGLMFKQPDNHIEYIISCLQKINGKKDDNQVKKEMKKCEINCLIYTCIIIDFLEKKKLSFSYRGGLR